MFTPVTSIEELRAGNSGEQLAMSGEEDALVRPPGNEAGNGHQRAEYLCYFMHRFLSFRWESIALTWLQAYLKRGFWSCLVVSLA